MISVSPPSSHRPRCTLSPPCAEGRLSLLGLGRLLQLEPGCGEDCRSRHIVSPWRSWAPGDGSPPELPKIARGKAIEPGRYSKASTPAKRPSSPIEGPGAERLQVPGMRPLSLLFWIRSQSGVIKPSSTSSVMAACHFPKHQKSRLEVLHATGRVSSLTKRSIHSCNRSISPAGVVGLIGLSTPTDVPPNGGGTIEIQPPAITLRSQKYFII